MVPRVFVAPHAESEVAGGDGEHDEGDDLECQTGQHDVLASVQEGSLLGRRCDTATASLQEQTDEVTGAEDDGIRAGFEPREVGAVDDDDSREAEVDSGTQEGWGNCQADEVEQKFSVAEGAVVHLNPSDIAYDLQQLMEAVSNRKRGCKMAVRTRPKNMAAM